MPKEDYPGWCGNTAPHGPHTLTEDCSCPGVPEPEPEDDPSVAHEHPYTGGMY